MLCVLASGAWGALGQSAPSDAELLRAKAQEFEARLQATARELEDEPHLRDLSQQQRKEAVEFVTGNVLFAIVHEMGHVLITEMGLPVLGREEDAADSHAVLVMLKVGDDFSHRVLVDAAKGWFVSDQRDRAVGDKAAFYDEHGVDRQRAYEIVCLMVGSDPEKFADLARDMDMPEERQETCQWDYSNASWSWETLLKPHHRAPGQPKTRIDVVYGEAKGEPDTFARLFRSIRLLETVAEVAAEEYVWRRPLTLEMRTCGNPGARWNVVRARVTVCYEMAAEFAQLYRDYIISQDRAKY